MGIRWDYSIGDDNVLRTLVSPVSEVEFIAGCLGREILRRGLWPKGSAEPRLRVRVRKWDGTEHTKWSEVCLAASFALDGGPTCAGWHLNQ